jgi:membrane-bound serine protease (ClpP class)
MRLVLRSRKWKQAAGSEEMLGEQGIAASGLKAGVEGLIRIHGENWRAVAQQDVSAGELVRVLKIEGLMLYVEPAKSQGTAKIST